MNQSTASLSVDLRGQSRVNDSDVRPELLQIDVEQVIRQRVPGIASKLPSIAFRFVEWLICQKELNQLLKDNAEYVDAEFCNGVFRSLDVKIDIENPDKLPSPDERRITFVSNHPLGGLDGMALIAALADRYGGRVYFVVNDLLMAVKPLTGVFVPVNLYGRQHRTSFEKLDRVLDEDVPVVFFPAGLVSRLRKGSDAKWWNPVSWFEISDLQWHNSFLVRSKKTRRDVVPLHFSGRNRLRFYIAARVRKMLGIKFNIEMILLPSELVASKRKSFKIRVGERLLWQQIQDGAALTRQAEQLRRDVTTNFVKQKQSV